MGKMLAMSVIANWIEGEGQVDALDNVHIALSV